VIEQVFDLSKTSIIQNAWRNRDLPMVHGWVYELKTGIIQDLGVSLHSKSEMPAIFNVTGNGATSAGK
jgi:carbonic anhydrase